MAKWASKISTVAFLVAISILLPAQAPTPEPVTDQETELGQAVYDQLKSKVEIIESSPLYDRLKPVVDAISRVAQSQYDHPFKFFLVHRVSAKRLRDPGWQRVCCRFPVVFRQKHRTACGHPLP